MTRERITWTTVDTQRDQSFPQRAFTRIYRCQNATAYRLCRLNVTANNGAGGLQLSDLELLSYGSATEIR